MKTYNPLQKLCCCAITLLLLILTNATFAQTLTSDASDYAPGTTCTLTGSGFQAGEDVSLVVHHADGTADSGADHDPWTVTADGDGNFVTTWSVCIDDCVGSMLLATADGQSSGAHAEATFTDNVTVTVTSTTSCITVDAGQVTHWNVVEGGSYTMTLSNTGCTGSAITVSIQNSEHGNFCYIATGSDGTYSFDFTMPNPACFTSPIKYKCDAGGDCSGGELNNTNNDLRASNFSGSYPDCGTRTDDEACCAPISVSSSGGCADDCPTLSVVGMTAGGSTTFQWQLSGSDISGATNSTYVACVAGSYSVTVSVGSNCSSSASITVDPCNTNCPPIGCSISGDNTVECGGTSHDYTISVNGCSGTPDITWSVSGDASIPGDTHGTTVTVVANSGCSGSFTVSADVTCNCGSGNPSTTSCNYDVAIHDDIAPVISTDATDGQNLGCNPTVTPPLFTADDNCQGAITPDVSTDGPSNDGCNYTQTWTANASDACGNPATPVSITYYWTQVTAPALSGCATSTTDLGCNPTTLPSCDDITINASNECGPVDVTCTPGEVVVNGCNHSQDIVYSATSCGLTSSCTHSYTWAEVTAPVFSCSSGTTALGCNPTLPVCNTSITASNECGPVPVTCTPGSIVSTGCSRSQCFTYSATACGLTSTIKRTFTWSVSSSVSITKPSPLPVCGLSGYTLSVTNNGPGTISSYSWSVSGAGWAIVGATTNSSITYTAGNSGTSGTFTVVVTNSCGCTSTGTVTFGSSCTEGCSYTQGFYGGTGKTCNQTTVQKLLYNATTSSGLLYNNPLTVGSTAAGCRSFTIGGTSSEATCLVSHMPSGTTPSVLPSTVASCSAVPSTMLNSGKFKSVLVGQCIALGLNIRGSSALGSMKISGAYITTYKASSCTSGVAQAGTKVVKGPIPASVLTALTNSGDSSVLNLWNLANKALGNCQTATTPSLSDWTAALDAINNAFDGCRILAGFGSSSGGLKADDGEVVIGGDDNSISDLNIYPNPAVDQVNVSFISSSDVNATIDIYNVNGVCVGHVISGVFAQGQASVVQLDASQWSQGVYFIRIDQGDKSAMGKFVLVK